MPKIDLKRCYESSLMCHLPPIKRFYRKLGHEYAYSDIYGAFHVAARYMGTHNFHPAPGIWQHGCFGPWRQVSAGEIAYHSPLINELKIYVARKDEQSFLESCGVYNSRPIGLPFVYAESQDITRRKNSLLVVPVHSIGGLPSFSEREDLSEYAKQINSLKRYFSDIVLCVHKGDIDNGYWVSEFGSYGIRYVVGADPQDMNSLPRVKALFSLFDFVTTNEWGSHVPYALSCGAKCSVWGEAPSKDLKMELRDAGLGGIENLKLRNSEQKKTIENSYISQLTNCPVNGKANKELGDFLIGMENKKSPQELYREFCWGEVGCKEKSIVMLNDVCLRIKEDVKYSIRRVARPLLSGFVKKVFRRGGSG